MEAETPEGSSEVEGRSKKLEVEERREMLSSAEVEGDAEMPYGGRRGGLPMPGNSRAVSYVEEETRRSCGPEEGTVWVEVERRREMAGWKEGRCG